MKYIPFFLLALIFIGCKEYNNDSGKLYLRQLVNTTTTTTSSSATYFLLYGKYNSGSTTVATIKMYANVNGIYRLLEYRMTDVGIKIDDKDSIPYLQIKYKDIVNHTVEELVNQSTYTRMHITLVCPERYLPEKLLPIQL